MTPSPLSAPISELKKNLLGFMRPECYLNLEYDYYKWHERYLFPQGHVLNDFLLI